MRGKDTTATDFRLPIGAKDGVFDFKPVTMRVYGGLGSGSLRMDRSAEVPVVQLAYSLRKVRIEEVFKTPASGRSVSGLMDFSTTLAMRGRTQLELRQSAGGEMALSGKDLTLAGVDLDKHYSKFEASQEFRPARRGRGALAGPVGLAVTKGYDFSSLAAESGGSTRILKLGPCSGLPSSSAPMPNAGAVYLLFLLKTCARSRASIRDRCSRTLGCRRLSSEPWVCYRYRTP